MRWTIQKPNWFDREYEDKFLDVPRLLAAISQHPRIVQAVTDALAKHRFDLLGPSQVQVVRTVLANVLQAED